MPEISVIVPVYKVEPYLRRCVDSILAQTFTDFELILVDDGSPDNSGLICDEYAEKDSRVRVIHKQNGGVSSARNAGIDAARGNWITFVDSDDYVAESYLDNLYEQTYDLIVVSHIHHTMSSGLKVKKSLIPMCIRQLDSGAFAEIIEKNGKYWMLFCWGRLYRHELMKKNALRFDETLSVGEDYVFFVRYLAYCRSISMKADISYQHIDYGTGTLSKTFNIAFFESMLRSEEIVNKVVFESYGVSSFGKTEEELTMIFSDSLCSIAADPNITFGEKNKILKYLFHNRYFLDGINNTERYFPSVSKKFKFLLKTKNPFLILCGLSIPRLKRNNYMIL